MKALSDGFITLFAYEKCRPVLLYSFSFCPSYEWKSLYPSGPEMVRYLTDVCNKFQITDKIQCNTDVEGCTWREKDQLWEVHLRHMVPGVGDLSSKERTRKVEQQGSESVFLRRETILTKVVVSCVGGLVEPNAFPKVPGAESFEGTQFHTARWNEDADMNDKDVVVCSRVRSGQELD